VCSLIPDPNERHQCYSVFGVDAQRMASYYDTVSRLEEQLDTDITNSTGECACLYLRPLVLLLAGNGFGSS
jgi:hypothetical protein